MSSSPTSASPSCNNQEPDLKLYKYRDLSNPSEVDFARLQTLLGGEAFWCARPDTLNDPEEFAWRCDYTASAETQELLTSLLIRVNGRERALAREIATIAVSQNRLPIVGRPIIEGMIQQCRNEIGLLCLGTSPDNPVLWERYGGKGAGVCVEVEVPDDLLGTQLFWVDYSSTKVIHIDQLMRSFLEPKRVAEVYRLALLSKPMVWAAEQEIRFVSRKQNALARIERSRITQVIFGDMLSGVRRRRIEEIVEAARIPSLVRSRPAITAQQD